VTDRKDASQAETPVDYDLTCWYLNRRRVLELVGIEAAAATGGMSDATGRVLPGQRSNHFFSPMISIS
jgi:hypothetical protein